MSSSLKETRKKIKKLNHKIQPKLILSITNFKNIGFKILQTDTPRKNPDSQDPFIQPEVDPTPRPKPVENPESEPTPDPDAPKKESKNFIH
ncbi:MAG TPA: hypothetical protein VHM20_08745 [Gammaproteobacteria bacterium]|jgi:hypothetical protein|nr:hypothetical protein [Gammaproteobacteria bacterium]